MRKLQPAVFFLDLFLPSLNGCLQQRVDLHQDIGQTY